MNSIEIKTQFEKYAQHANAIENCNECPFDKQCQAMHPYPSGTLCEVITGKKFTRMTPPHLADPRQLTIFDSGA